jgi:hypothetical protein
LQPDEKANNVENGFITGFIFAKAYALFYKDIGAKFKKTGR